ncbi:MAG: peptide chain release factor 1 [candidate division Zixibacteria bacterium]|nr:peptide chain release factor 1 [candidate division Zixibacteria bacterium]
MLDSSIIERLREKHADLTEKLSDPEILGNHKKYSGLAREHSELEDMLKVADEYQDITARVEEDRKMLESSEDKELIELAESELEELEPKLEILEEKLRLMLAPKDPNDRKSAIVEIRAGTGGEEAALFAADLYRMYSRYIENKGWKLDVLNSNPTGVGGFKEIIFSVEGADVYGSLKFESGVHRVQRVPATEASGRIHTSAASVAILPEADAVDVDINPNDLKIDVFRSSGPGGQSVNTTDSAVRITHLPTNTVVSCQDEKSQLKNKNKAMKVLRARLMDKAQKEQQSKLATERKAIVGTGDRSEKIRTYNFPQNRVTDHRIGLTLHNLEGILGGELDEVIEKLNHRHREQMLASETAESTVN